MKQILDFMYLTFFYSFVVSPVVLRGMNYGSLMNMSHEGLVLVFMHILFIDDSYLFIFDRIKTR